MRQNYYSNLRFGNAIEVLTKEEPLLESLDNFCTRCIGVGRGVGAAPPPPPIILTSLPHHVPAGNLAPLAPPPPPPQYSKPWPPPPPPNILNLPTPMRCKMGISAEKIELMTNSANGIQREIKVKDRSLEQ